ncbi:type I-B CRISPR-associated protein Cas5b [Parapedobacter koreensis]|nr:type I-B CRISPR-associated protein Cas5b [Parapedobacter koreensis]
MAHWKLISFDLKANFAFFKKPDYNDGLQLSYNMLHKPGLLGILGAIVGLEGYKQKGELPMYYQQFKHLLVSIEPLGHEKGNFQKTSVKYTNGVGYANADGNLLVEETMLVAPAYRCYVLLDTGNELEAKLHDYIIQRKAEFIPYLGKNEFQAWLADIHEWDYSPLNSDRPFAVDSLFVKSGSIKNQIVETEISFDFSVQSGSFTYFERLPIGFDEKLMQYQLNDFAYTDWRLKSSSKIANLYTLKEKKNELLKNIQLF